MKKWIPTYLIVGDIVFLHHYAEGGNESQVPNK